MSSAAYKKELNTRTKSLYSESQPNKWKKIKQKLVSGF